MPPTEGERTNELTELARFISDHAADAFDRHLGTLLGEAGQLHDNYAGNCQVQHYHDEFPCDEFERGVSLGIAWLKARISDRPTKNTTLRPMVGGAPDGS